MKTYKIWGLVNKHSGCLVQLFDIELDKHYSVPAIFKTRKAARTYIKSVMQGVGTLSWSKIKIERITIKGR